METRRKHLNTALRIAAFAAILLVLCHGSAFCAGMCEILEQMPESASEASASPEPSAAPERTLAPADPEVGPMADPPASVSPAIHLYTKSALESNLRLDARSLRYPRNGMSIPLLYQFDYTTPFCTHNGRARSVKTSGCGATVISMLDVYINGNLDQTPYTVLYKAAESGGYAGQGLDYVVMLELAADCGIEIERVDRSEASMREALENGHPVILCMGPGEFTYAGHYILLRGLDRNGNALVNDPNSESHAQMSFPLKQLNREAKTPDMMVVLSEQKR